METNMFVANGSVRSLGNSSFISGESPYTSGELTIGGTSGMGVMKAKEVQVESLKFVKTPNKFYKYTVRLIDLTEKDLPTNDRIKFEATKTIEIAADQNLRDAVLIKHALDFQNVFDYESMNIEVDILNSWEIKV